MAESADLMDAGAGDFLDALKQNEDIWSGYLLARIGINLNYFLFPGLILHELAHYLFAIISGSHVVEVVFWSPTGGHVLHTRVRGSSSVLISFAPLFVNNFMALIFLQDGFNVLRTAGIGLGESLWGLGLLWLGFSFAVYSFPSAPDLRVSMAALKRSFDLRWEGGILTKLVSIIVYPLLFLFHGLLVLVIIPFSTNRSLRLVWAVALAAFFLIAVGPEQLI